MPDLSQYHAKVNAKPFIQNSVALPPHLYECDEYFCRFTPRIHRDAQLADAGSWQCQVDFLESSKAARADAVRLASTKSYAVGCINPVVGNFSALCACEALPDRLALTTYMVEYAYIHDDVIEYAEDKSESQLLEANQQLVEGLDMNDYAGSGTKDHVRRRQLQAKMAVEMLDLDKAQGQECLRLWKEMSDVFVEIRDLDFKIIEDYLHFRVVDAGCPWTMSLLCFSMDFALSDEESKETADLTRAAYDAWVLVNDYFSWDKEWKNHEANGSTGMIASAVFLYMKWYGLNAQEARKRLRQEIIVREEKYIQLKDEFLARGKLTEKTIQWLDLLDLVTAGNFAWSMTTARYHHDAEDSYPELRVRYQNTHSSPSSDGLSDPISLSAEKLARSAILETVPNPIHHGRKDSADVAITTKTSTLDKVNGHNGVVNGVVNGIVNGSNGIVNGLVNGNVNGTHGTNGVNGHKGEKGVPQVPDVPSLYSFEELILEPEKYITSMPSKGVRNTVIDGLEAWYQVPESSLETIREIVNMLHSSSLMIDDIEDGSSLRRGLPATHTVFGVNQTINSANLIMFKASKAAASLSLEALNLFTDKIIEGHIGQGLDLHWTFHTKVPTEEEYFSMVDGKTGGLFVLLAQLMRSEATVHKDVDLAPLMLLFGRFFQARDDYQNLASTEYAAQKGVADDISEGKISLPIIHALNTPSIQRGRLLSILQMRKAGAPLSEEVLKMAVKELREAGGLEYAKKTAESLQESTNAALAYYETEMGARNYILRLVQKRLELDA